jgi:hypothetical protein
MPRGLKADAPDRSVTDVGPGDFIKMGGVWQQIVSNSATGATRTPRSWSIRTQDGRTYGMYQIQQYAKASDME